MVSQLIPQRSLEILSRRATNVVACNRHIRLKNDRARKALHYYARKKSSIGVEPRVEPLDAFKNIFPLHRLPSLSKYRNGQTIQLFDKSPLSNFKLAFGGMIALQLVWGSSTEGQAFYDYRYITNKDPDDVASFYGGEELMELFCVFPLAVQLMMRSAEFDDEGNVHTYGFPGKMKVQMVFSDETDEETEQTLWFNKRERFKDTLFGITMWDFVINYGFTHLPDGRLECYHQAEHFKGYAPPFSLIMKLVFRIHARYMVWATEHHINHYAFTAKTEEEEEREEESRSFLLLRIFKEFFIDDLKAMITGSEKETDSFLTKDEEDEDEEDEEEEESAVGEMADELDLGKPRHVVLRRHATVSSVIDLKNRIDEDIAFDKMMSQDDIKISDEALEKSRSSGMAYADAYQMATLAAMHRHQTRVVRRRTTRLIKRKTTNSNQKNITVNS